MQKKLIQVYKCDFYHSSKMIAVPIYLSTRLYKNYKHRREKKYIQIDKYSFMSESANLSHPQDGKPIKDYLPWCIDLFDKIFNNKLNISSTINNASTENYQLNPRWCENHSKEIDQIGETGIKAIKNYKTIMIWNRIFHINKIFSHLNI